MPINEVQAIKECFIGAGWQRCQVHFMRNVVDKLPRKNTEEVRAELKSLFKTTNLGIARTIKNELVEKYSEKYPRMVSTRDEGFEDAFHYCSSSLTHDSRLKSTNMLERANEEIRRREKGIRIFPNEASALRLIGSVLLDIHDKWTSSNRQYINFTEETIKLLTLGLRINS